MMTEDFKFDIKSIRFDENYLPSVDTRLTTNFANLARGEKRQDNLRLVLKMIDRRFNSLVYWDNPSGDRYRIELEIISVGMRLATSEVAFPAIEMLRTSIVDLQTGVTTDGLVGNNFSSYVRDYDFSVLLPRHNAVRDSFQVPKNFGNLHGRIFSDFVGSKAYRENFPKPPVICLSVSNNKTYRQTTNRHPVMGFEYSASEPTLTEEYFKKMGLQVRYFMPNGAAAPLAFYFFDDLLQRYSNLELIATISTMETFQRIYRPEIYNANCAAGQVYRPDLANGDYSVTKIDYDRDERSELAVEQGMFAERNFIEPYQVKLAQYIAGFSA